MKKFNWKNFINRFLNISTEIFLSLSIILFFLLTILYIITNYKDILKFYGINIKDDCKINIHNISCSYISIKSKDLDINLKDIYIDFYWKNLFNNNHLADIKINQISGNYISIPQKEKTTEIPEIYYIYLLTNYSFLNIKNFNLDIKKDKDTINIFAENIYNQKNKIFWNNFNVVFDKYKILAKKVDKTDFIIYPDKLELKNLKSEISTDYGKIDGLINISLSDDTNLGLSGDLNSELLKIKNANLNGNTAKIDINGYQFEKFKIETKLNTKLINIDNIQIKGADNRLKGYIDTDKNKGRFELVSNIDRFSFQDYIFENIKNKTDIKIDKTLSIEGKAKTDLATIDYKLQDKKFSFWADNIKISDFIKSKDKILSSINGFANIDGEYYLDKELINLKIKANRLSFIGLNFNNAQIDINSDIKNDKTLINAILSDKAVLKVNGNVSLKNKEINLNLDGKNINIDNLIFTKDVGIKSNLDINGNLSLKGEDFTISLKSFAKNFSYKEINLNNIQADFYMQNDKININASNIDKSIKSNIDIDLKPFSLKLNLDLNNADGEIAQNYLKNLLPDIFSKISPLKTSGKINIYLDEKDYNLTLKDINSLVKITQLNDTINTNINGFINPKEKDLTINFDKKQFKDFSYISGKIFLKNDDIKTELNIEGLKDFDKFNLISNLNINLKEKLINGNTNIDINKKDIISNILISHNGSFEKLSGIAKLRINKDTNILNYNIDLKQNLLNIDTKKFELSFKDIKLSLQDLNLKANTENLEGSIYAKNLEVSKDLTPILLFPQFSSSFDKNQLKISKLYHIGTLTGNIEYLIYNFSENKLNFYANGKIDKKLTSELIQFVNINTDLNYTAKFNDTIDKIPENISLQIYGQNVGIKTPYTQGIINFNKTDIKIDKIINLYLEGDTKTVFGRSKALIMGYINLKPFSYQLSIITGNIPVKYEKLYQGIINTNISIAGKEEHSIIGLITTTGKVNINLKDLEKKETKEKPEILKKIKLNIDVESASSIEISGDWGRAFADGKITITGTAYQPIINGNINISYGKVYFLKNIYNIDFASIKIINNEPYINGRLSTNVSGNFIFINIYGNINNLKYDFYSTPPKTKDEILTMLLLKRAPSQFEELPIFSIVGEVAKTLIPTKQEEEEKGLFGTGVNINVIPSYNPTEGVTFSLYAQKYLSRRLYIALSKPISKFENYIGWYEFGVKTSERTSITFKSFENNTHGLDITFSLPFDF